MDRPSIVQPKREVEKEETIANYAAEWCGMVIFMCIAVLAVAGTYKLLTMMF